ncbi:hypothetical protein U1Q18_030131 [Sarracenia purpurea var. burkii]
MGRIHNGARKQRCNESLSYLPKERDPSPPTWQSPRGQHLQTEKISITQKKINTEEKHPSLEPPVPGAPAEGYTVSPPHSNLLSQPFPEEAAKQ